MVKRLRRRPLTAQSRVRFPARSPKKREISFIGFFSFLCLRKLAFPWFARGENFVFDDTLPENACIFFGACTKRKTFKGFGRFPARSPKKQWIDFSPIHFFSTRNISRKLRREGFNYGYTVIGFDIRLFYKLGIARFFVGLGVARATHGNKRSCFF